MYPPPPKKMTICTITKSLTIANFTTIYLATIHILPQHRHCKELSHKNLTSPHTSPCPCVAPPLKKEHLHNYIIFDQCQLFSQHSTLPVQIWDNMGRVKVYQKNLTSLCRSSWVSPKIYYLPNCMITDPCQLYLNILRQFKFDHNVGRV